MSGLTLEQVQGDQVESVKQGGFLPSMANMNDQYQPGNMNQQGSYALTGSTSDGVLNHNPAYHVQAMPAFQYATAPHEWSSASDPHHASYLHGYSGEGQQPPTSYIPDHQTVYRPSSNGFANSYGCYSYGGWNSMMPESNSSRSLNHQSVPSVPNGGLGFLGPPYTNGGGHDFLRSPGESLPNTNASAFGFHSETASSTTTGFNRPSVNTSLQSKDLLTKSSEPCSFGGIDELKYVDTRMASLNLGGGGEQLPAMSSPFSILGQQGRSLSTAVQSNSLLSGSPVVGSVGSRAEPKTLAAPAVAAPAPVKKHTWAAIASRPAKAPQPQLKPKSAGGLQAASKTKDGTPQVSAFGQSSAPKPVTQQRWVSHKTPTSASGGAVQATGGGGRGQATQNDEKNSAQSSPQAGSGGKGTLEVLKSQNDYNPKRLNIDGRSARFFVIKSYSEDDIHRSIKYDIWCSTEHGNKRLDAAFREQKGKGSVILLFSVNGSGHFCGVAEMLTPIDYSKRADFWTQDKWKGKFKVKWIYAKDVPNSMLRHIRLENNENKPVTNSRDTQEVPVEKGCQVLKIISQYKHQTSIFDDFAHYERRQAEEDVLRKKRDSQREKDGSYTSKEK